MLSFFDCLIGKRKWAKLVVMDSSCQTRQPKAEGQSSNKAPCLCRNLNLFLFFPGKTGAGKPLVDPDSCFGEAKKRRLWVKTNGTILG